MNLFEGIEKNFIKDLEVGQRINTYYKIVGLEKRIKRDGGSYLTLELLDKTGKISAKVWNNVPAILNMIVTGGFYRISGMVNKYLDNKEIKVDQLRPVSSKDIDFKESDYQEKASYIRLSIIPLQKNHFQVKLISKELISMSLVSHRSFPL